MLDIRLSTRFRASPFYDATVASGATGFTGYNQMLLPTTYGDPEGEYWRLKNGVSVWDVGAQRQVQLEGPDAARLAQILSTRDLSSCQVGQGKYVALCNHAGVLINDPIAFKIDEDQYRFSIADSSILFWARAVCAERNLDVAVTEPDISPLAIQGPKAEDVVASILGDWVRSIKYFWFSEAMVEDVPVMVSRSGWSKQGGYELFLLDAFKGTKLWNIVLEAGRAWEIAPGTPNHAERVESGLLSYGADCDDTTNPLELRMQPYVSFDLPNEVIGIESLRRIRADGVKRRQLGITLDGDQPLPYCRNWLDVRHDNRDVGSLTTLVWSYGMNRNIGLAIVPATMNPGDRVQVTVGGKSIDGTLVDLPFLS